MLKSAILAAACLATTLVLPARAEMTEDQRKEFRAEVRAYLLENPEVLSEAIGILQDRQAAEEAKGDVALVAANSAAIFADAASWVGGNPDGDVVIVEFMDYRCGYCRKANAEVDELVTSDGNIRFIVKEFPILGPESDLSSRFAISVLQMHGPEAYLKAHDALIALRGPADEKNLQRLAGDLGLAAEPIMAHMKLPEVEAVIAANHGLAQSLQINGTPTFVIGDTLVRGYVPLDGMRDMVAGARKTKG